MSIEKQKELVFELAELAINKARALGCDASINFSVGKEYATRFSNSAILQNYVDLRRNMEITLIYNERQRVASRTNNFSQESVLSLIEYLAKVVRAVPPDPAYPGIVREKQSYPSLSLNDPKASSIDPDDIVDKIEAAINAGDAIDKRIGGVSGNFLLSDGFEYYVSTADNELFYPSTTINSTININALEGGEESRSNSSFGSRFFDKLNMEKEAEEVAERAVQGLGAQSIEPRDYEVVLDHQAVSTLLFFVGYATSSRLVINRASFLADKIGQQVFDEDLTLFNDPHNPEHLAARPIDDEGLATQKFPVFEQGILK
ncbi:MAG: TldD/PmbA family protein, partial [Candidatus Heimdallarchaeaceae archaeon]